MQEYALPSLTVLRWADTIWRDRMLLTSEHVTVLITSLHRRLGLISHFIELLFLELKQQNLLVLDYTLLIHDDLLITHVLPIEQLSVLRSLICFRCFIAKINGSIVERAAHVVIIGLIVDVGSSLIL